MSDAKPLINAEDLKRLKDVCFMSNNLPQMQTSNAERPLIAWSTAWGPHVSLPRIKQLVVSTDTHWLQIRYINTIGSLDFFPF